jgi:hypothetical protein
VHVGDQPLQHVLAVAKFIEKALRNRMKCVAACLRALALQNRDKLRKKCGADIGIGVAPAKRMSSGTLRMAEFFLSANV